jgi:hypothetical protein
MKMDITLITQQLNKTNDTNHIAFCMRTEKTPETRNLFGYIRENKYSLGGLPTLNTTVYFDSDIKGPC